MHWVAMSVRLFQQFLEWLWKCNTRPLLSHQSWMSTLFISFFLYQANAWRMARSVKTGRKDIFWAVVIYNLWERTFGQIWEIKVNCEQSMQHVQCSRVTLNRASTCSSCMAMKMDQITWNTKAGQSASEFLAYTLLSFNDSAPCNSILAAGINKSILFCIFCLTSDIWGKRAVHCCCQGQKTANQNLYSSAQQHNFSAQQHNFYGQQQTNLSRTALALLLPF